MEDIKGYEGKYAITKQGNIWSYPHTRKVRNGSFRQMPGKWLKQYVMSNGYHVVDLYHGVGKKNHYLVHRLVAFSFLQTPTGAKEINHKDGNKSNNSVENLEWVTSKQNKVHGWETGLYKHKGSVHYKTRLTEEDVKIIREAWKAGEMTQKEIADIYRITRSSVSHVVNGKTWRHLTTS